MPRCAPLRRYTTYCSGLLGRTSLRQVDAFPPGLGGNVLFRPSRPDFIETVINYLLIPLFNDIVPAF